MKKVAVIKIVDQINIVIIGLDPDHYEYFYDKYGYFAPNYAFSPSYKLGRWDGKIRFFSKTGVTSIHYVHDIAPKLKSWGYSIKINDKRKRTPIEVPSIDEIFLQDKGITLGKHQYEAVNAVTTNNGGIVIGGTGAGKGLIAGALVKLYAQHASYRCLVIVPNTDLVTQTSEEIARVADDVGVYYSKKKELSKTHLVSTWQSLQNNAKIIATYDVVIIDEAHGAKGNVLKQMIQEHASNAAVIIGLTGTLPKDKCEAESVRYVLGEVVYEVPAHTLMELGWLAKLKINCISTTENFKQKYKKHLAYLKENNLPSLGYTEFKNTYFPDYTSERNYLKSKQERNEFISELIQMATEKSGNSFVLVGSVDYGKKLAKMIPDAIFVYGQDDSKVRKKIYSLFADNNNVIVISTFQLASTGLNIKRIFNFFMIDAGKSFIQVIQSIGRSIRKADDKDSVTAWDISSDLKYSKSHLNARKKYYKEQKYTHKISKIEYEPELDENDQVVIY